VLHCECCIVSVFGPLHLFGFSFSTLNLCDLVFKLRQPAIYQIGNGANSYKKNPSRSRKRPTIFIVLVIIFVFLRPLHLLKLRKKIEKGMTQYRYLLKNQHVYNKHNTTYNVQNLCLCHSIHLKVITISTCRCAFKTASNYFQ